MRKHASQRGANAGNSTRPSCARARKGRPFLSLPPSQPLGGTGGGPSALARLAEGNVGGGGNPSIVREDRPLRGRAPPRHSHTLTGARLGLGQGAGRMRRGGERGGWGRPRSVPLLAGKFLERGIQREPEGMGRKKTAESPKYTALAEPTTDDTLPSREEAWGQGSGLGDAEWRGHLKDGGGGARTRGSDG